MAVRIAVSVTVEQARDLREHGPRRDFIELAEATGGEILFQQQVTARSGLRSKLLGPHLRQAWQLARYTRSGDHLFADGEHVGLPLLLLLALRRARPARIVILGHLLTRRWKLPLLWLATRLGLRGVIVVHSVVQATAVRRWLGGRWSVELVPYQVDTDFWTKAPIGIPPDEGELPLVLAVGSENRDYETLVQAVRGIPARVVIAAGSHWARRIAGSANLPANVDYRSEALSFAELRDLYARATVVVVPLLDVPNQSGVTTILEAFSMGLPVIATASRGQRECVAGPLVTTRSVDVWATRDRGPQLFEGEPGTAEANGMYVPPHDPLALRYALDRLLLDSSLREQLGTAARQCALRHFSIERYTARLVTLLEGPATAEPGSVVTA